MQIGDSDFCNYDCASVNDLRRLSLVTSPNLNISAVINLYGTITISQVILGSTKTSSIDAVFTYDGIMGTHASITLLDMRISEHADKKSKKMLFESPYNASVSTRLIEVNLVNTEFSGTCVVDNVNLCTTIEDVFDSLSVFTTLTDIVNNYAEEKIEGFLGPGSDI